jgi:hypothetical protein
VLLLVTVWAAGDAGRHRGLDRGAVSSSGGAHVTPRPTRSPLPRLPFSRGAVVLSFSVHR